MNFHKNYYKLCLPSILASAAIMTGFIWGANTVKNLIDKPKKVEEEPVQKITKETQNIAQINVNA